MFGKSRLQLWQLVAFWFLLMITLMLVVGCNPKFKETFTPLTLVPTPVAGELPAEVKMARDAALVFVNSNYDAGLRFPDANWTVERIVLENIGGTCVYRLTSDRCVVTVSYSSLHSDSAIYHVVLDDSAADFHWEGDVDAEGKVSPLWWPEDDPSVSSVPPTINLVTLTNLRTTVGIEICHLDYACYTPLYSIGNPELIAALVDALDTDIQLRPRARCPATYQLRFVLANGQHFDFGYACQMMTPTFLRGNQEFWHGQDIVAPDVFNELMLPLLAPGSVEGYSW